jgi:hypothetical protein
MDFVDLQMGLQTSSINVKGSLYVSMTLLTATVVHGGDEKLGRSDQCLY